MNVTIIANISANGRLLVANNPHHQLPSGAMEFYVQFVRQVGNVVIGSKTFENFQKFPKEVKELFNEVEIVILSDASYLRDGYKTVGSPEEAIEYVSGKGLKEIAVGGGIGTFNSFIDKDLVTDIYFNINPLITGVGGILASNSELNVNFKLKKSKLKEGFLQLHLIKENES